MITQKEIGYLVGLFQGDGYAHYNPKDRRYRVEFYLNSIKDNDIEKRLVYLLQKMKLNYW